MKKSLLLVLSIPLLAGCSFSSAPAYKTENQSTETPQDEVNPGSQEDEKTEQGTEGSEINTNPQSETDNPKENQNKPDDDVDHDNTEETDPIHGDSGTGTTSGGDSGSGGGGESGQGTSGDEGGSGSGQGTSGGEGSGSDGQGQTTSITVEKDVSELGLSNGNKPTTININNDISITCDVGTNANKNAPAYYESDLSLRFYPNNTLKFTNSKGVIDKIVLSVNGNSFSSSCGQMNNNTWTGSASEVTLTAGGTKNNAKLYSFVITYKTSGGGISSGGGSDTGGGTDSGEGGTETGGGGSTVVTGDYTSTWPSEYQKYVITYLNGAVPCFLNTNKKCLFNYYDTGAEEGTGVPYFNPQIKNTSPGINYEYDYSVILKDAGFKNDGDDVDEGVTWHNYSKGNYEVRFAKYKGTDNIYVFDVYMVHYYLNTTTFTKTYTFQHDDKNLALTSKYESNNKTLNVNNWKITLTDIQKNSYYMQLRKDTGKIVIEGNIKGVYLEILRNSDAAFVKAGTSASNVKYVFNNGFRFDFPDGTKYVEISAQSRVLEFEFFEIGY